MPATSSSKGITTVKSTSRAAMAASLCSSICRDGGVRLGSTTARGVRIEGAGDRRSIPSTRRLDRPTDHPLMASVDAVEIPNRDRRAILQISQISKLQPTKAAVALRWFRSSHEVGTRGRSRSSTRPVVSHVDALRQLPLQRRVIENVGQMREIRVSGPQALDLPKRLVEREV